MQANNYEDIIIEASYTFVCIRQMWPYVYLLLYILLSCSKDHKLPNLDAAQQTVRAEQHVMPTGERRHFPSNINKTGYIIFSVSYKYLEINHVSVN